jgi:polyphosphate kinase 2 (PPK2 family)
MGFCGEDDAQRFFDDAPIFEQMLMNAGIRLFKYYLASTGTSRRSG